MSDLPKHASYDPDRHGNDRWYYRRGNLRMRLAGRPGDDLFQRSYDAAHAAYELHGRVSYVYFLRVGVRVKIGTSINLKTRVSALRSGIAGKSALTHATLGDRALESQLHYRFKTDRIRGEWFRFSDEIRAWIKADQEQNRHGACLTPAPVLSHLSNSLGNSNG